MNENIKLAIYLDGAGFKYFNVLTESEQIIFCWKQLSKRYRTKSHQTRYWLDLYEKYFDFLIKSQAYEIVNFLKTKTTIEQRKRREERRLFDLANAQIELAYWEEIHNDLKLRSDLLKPMNPN